MANLTVTATAVKPVALYEQMPDGPAAEAINAGQPVRLDTTNGKYTLANGTTAAEARVLGIALNTATAGQTVSVLRKGLIDLGGAITQAYDAPIYLSDSDGTLGDTAGTVSTVIGRVLPAWGATAADKLLFVDL
jgi:predicted RecA/RadA family phage recombinase